MTARGPDPQPGLQGSQVAVRIDDQIPQVNRYGFQHSVSIGQVWDFFQNNRLIIKINVVKWTVVDSLEHAFRRGHIGAVRVQAIRFLAKTDHQGAFRRRQRCGR